VSSTSRTRKIVVGAVAAASLGVGGLTVAAVNPLGAVGAQEEDPAPSTTTPPAEGERGGRERPRILDGVLDELVEDGTLTQDQADAVRGGVQEGAQAWRDEHPRGNHGRPGHGPGRRGVPGLRGAWEAAAEAIGVEPDALREGRRDGSSIAEIAEEAGVERQAVIDAVVAKATELIDGAVADGHLEEERATELKAGLPEHAKRFIDAKRPAR